MTNILWQLEPEVAKTATSSDATSYSDLALDGIGQKAFSLEKNFTLLDGTFAPSTDPVNFWSADIGNGNYNSSNFGTLPMISIAFGAAQTGGFTLLFDTLTGDYCRNIIVEYYDGGVWVDTITFNPDEPIYYCDYTGAAYDSVDISFGQSLPYRRAKLDGIVVGEIKTFSGNDIANATIVKDIHLDGETVPFGTLNVTVFSATDISAYFASRQRIDVIYNDIPLGVYYLQSAKRVGKKQWQISAVDGIGVLDQMQFAGSVYVGNSAKTIAASILSGSPLTLDASGVSDITVTGLLMAQTCRNALQQLFFRWGVLWRVEGTTLVLYDEPNTSQKTIPNDDTYQGAAIEIEGDKSGVSLTAHTYVPNSDGSIEVGGVYYQDSTAVYSSSYGVSGAANVVAITGATLIPDTAAPTVLARMYSYYARRNKWKGRIVWRGEDLGERMTFRTAWANQVGTIYKLTLKISGIVAAEVEALE